MSTTIAGVSSMATRVILAELARRYQAERGIAVEIRAMGGVDAARLIRAGERTDIVILASGAMKGLESDGLIVPGTIKGFTRSGMAIAVRAGGARPQIANEEQVRRAVLAAVKVAYSTGPSGDHLLQLCERWGVPAERLVKAPPGVPVGELVARGEAELGFQQLSEFLEVPGIEILGPLPPDIQATTVFSAGVCSASTRADATAALIAWLVSPETAEVKRANGMEPAAGR